MRILLIGGTGVLSTAVTQEALRQNIEVTMINRGHNRKRIPINVELIIADKNNTGYIKDKLSRRKFNAVIDFLCFNAQQLEKSFNLYKELTNQYFFISSACVYNNSVPGPCKEDHPKVQPLWDYSINKWKGEEKLRELVKGTEVKYTIIRPMMTYDDTRIPYGIAPLVGFHGTIIQRIIHNKPIITWNKGQNKCNIMRVEDFAIGLVGLIGNEKAYNEEFNICGDEEPSYKEVLDTVGRILSHNVTTIDIDPDFYAQENPGRKGELLGGRAIDNIIDNGKLKAVVPNFKQNIVLAEGLKQTIEAYKMQDWQRGIDWEFEATTDKTIKKWCRQQHIGSKQYNLEFIDYLGNATKKDRINYWMEMHSDNLFVSSCKMINLTLRQAAYKLMKQGKVK